MIYWHTMLRMHGEKEEPRHTSVGGEEQAGNEPEQNTWYRQVSYVINTKSQIKGIVNENQRRKFKSEIR